MPSEVNTTPLQRATRKPVALMCLWALTACGGAEEVPSAMSPSPASPSPQASPTEEPIPLVAPKGCRPNGAQLEISALNASWLDEKGRPIPAGKACLAAPADEPFEITLHNDPNTEGTLNANHNVSIYTDSTAAEEVFFGDLAYPGESTTYDVPALPPQLYFFRCDVHPADMTGVLLVR
jgi:hypothetical protein